MVLLLQLMFNLPDPSSLRLILLVWRIPMMAPVQGLSPPASTHNPAEQPATHSTEQPAEPSAEQPATHGPAANVHGKELQQGAANAQGMGLQQGERLGDPMLAEAATAGGEWETMKRKQKSNRHHKKITAASVGAAAATGVGAKIAPASGVVAVVAGADSCVAAGAAIAGAVAAKHALTVALN
ncbi:hypothetical protein IMY05_005G0121200 [Salix suchowensis]|nr:hypothetical protein IMY05_005G0121200 [Salix suchowensis]